MVAEVADRIFADNRAIGRIAMSAKLSGGCTRRDDLLEEGALRLRCPGPPAPELEAVVVNTAGGMASGDRFEIDLAVGAGARVMLTSAAAEKVYRSTGPDTIVSAKIKVAPGAMLAWLPQETILFDRSRLRRSIEIDLAGDARILLAESIIFGRTGMGEVVAEGLLHDRWRVRRDGRLLHVEAARLDGPISQRLARTAVSNGGVAVATILLVPGDEETVAAVRAASQQSRGEMGASSWNGLTVIRLVASDGAALRDDLLRILTAIRGAKLPRLWLH